MQTFANKTGAINLRIQFEREKTPEMREAILGVLGGILKSQNFEGKRQYVVRDGITQLCNWLTQEEYVEKCGKGAINRKIKQRLTALIHDLASNDDSILNNGYAVRK